MNIKTIALITATILGGGSLLATNNTYADTPITIPFEDVNMCNAVAGDIGSDKIEENNCSDETNPNIIMTDSNIESITNLSLSGKNISDITGIEYFTNSTSLGLDNNQITDLTPLSSLTNLSTLYLSKNQISDIYPLSNLKSLTYLDLYDNQISDLTPLSGLTDLTQLYLDGNSFSDITPILLLNLPYPPFGERFQSIITSTVTTRTKEYILPSLYLFWGANLDIEPVAPWVTEAQDQMRGMIDAGIFGFEAQNAVMSEDNRSIVITDTTKPAVINFYGIADEDKIVLSSLTVIYEGPVDPVDPVDPTDDPAVPNTGNNTQESSTAILTATLCILSGIALAAIPMIRLYRKTNSK